jgi:hypothetical protein
MNEMKRDSDEATSHRPLSREEFTALLQDRIDEIERGEVETVDAFEVLQAARERLKNRSQ